MGRIIGIDFGLKRTGLAWTDPMQIIATGLETVETPKLMARLRELFEKENLEGIVLGMPYKLDGSPTDTTQPVLNLHKKLKATFPNLRIDLQDEQYSSKRAMQTMIGGGVPKKKRRNKALIDQVSATIILQDYLAEKPL